MPEKYNEKNIYNYIFNTTGANACQIMAHGLEYD